MQSVNKIKIVCAVWSVLALLSCGATEWRNIDQAHHLAGRKTSEGYLRDKVVLVVRWDVKSADADELLTRCAELWESFKNKQFVLLGAPILEEGSSWKPSTADLKFPIYAGAGIAKGEPAQGSFYVVDETGKIVYRGRSDRDATQAIVQAITDADAPKDVKMWCKFLDYEFTSLPAHAFLRMKDFRKRFPKDAKAYETKFSEIKKINDIEKVADLVAFAKRAKDPPVFNAKEKNKRRKYESLVKDILEKCRPLKAVEDFQLQQEAKNALADLTWAAATF